MTPTIGTAEREALARYLLAMADDELVIGYRDTEWTGAGPTLEEDLAFSSMGVDEVGHARLCYSLLHDLTGKSIDYRAREPSEYLHAQFLERPAAPRYVPTGAHEAPGDWSYAIVRQHLYDLFDSLRLEALSRSAWEPLAQAVDKVRREEKYHLQHGRLWVERLAAGTADARTKLEQALSACWADALGLFEPVEGEDLLIATGLVPRDSDELRHDWLDQVSILLTPYGLPLPAERDAVGRWQLGVTPTLGGRRGVHSADWQQLWDEMTSVYRLDPTATW
jgi:ring-1,2-phenylacetyl-CoA epoxidase subunit PaaC